MALEYRRVHGLVARTGVPTNEPTPRTITNVTIRGNDGKSVPVMRGTPRTGRELVGVGQLEVVDEGVMVTMDLPPYLAADLLGGELHCHIEGVGGDVESTYNPETGGRDLLISGMQVSGVFCDRNPPAWSDTWLVEQ